ncbi:Histidine--tRNA ligase [Scenedesmus sp. PABB004]|nr:Histidine--tRNA ligase [Scenedesmus sp. PABB004]
MLSQLSCSRGALAGSRQLVARLAGARQQQARHHRLAAASAVSQAEQQQPAPAAEPAEQPQAEAGKAAGGKAARKVGAAGPAAPGAKGMIDTSPPRGTRDFYPEEMRLRNWLFGEMEAVAQLFGFEQFDVPVLESEELFVRKAGEEITDQLYNFQDKGGRRVALRPEITPSLARLVLGKGKGLALPQKWWIIGQCWRYERMTRGRRREHYQWNMDVIGVTGVEAEAELLAAIVAFFERLGLTPADVGLKVSSRKVLAAVLERYAVPRANFAQVCVVVDKLEKLPRDKVEEELAALGVAADAIDGARAAAAGAAPQRPRAGGARGAGAAAHGGDALADLRRLWALAEGYGFQEWLVFDASVVRGLAYYTGVVFEGFDRAGALRAICGGGRYDALLGTFGGEDVPCAGFGFGDAVIVELLKDRGLLPAPAQQVDDVVLVMDEALRPAACGVAARLRAAGRRVDLVLELKKLKWAFKQAERAGAARLLLVGGEEWGRGAVAVRDLAARTQAEVPVAELVPGGGAS